VLIIPSSWGSQLDGGLHHQHHAASRSTKKITFCKSIKNVPIATRYTNIKIPKEDHGRMIYCTSMMSITNSVPSIFQTFSSLLLKSMNPKRMTAQLGTPRGRYDEHSSKSSHSMKPRFIQLVGERTNFRRLMLAGLVSAPDNLYMAPYLGRSFAPAATWNLHTTQPSTLLQLTVRLPISSVCCKQRIKRIMW
jgi:hypothetical protein